jgi:hypothetical protein
VSRGSAARAAAALLLSVAFVSCAPHVVAPPRLEPSSIAARYRLARDARAALASVVDAEASAWLSGDSLGGLPGVHARLALGAPDAFRVRIESMFGVALDFAAWGDSLACYLPPRRVGLTLDAATDLPGLRAPGPLGVRVLAATWQPPEAAWTRADFEDSILVVRWEERGDSLALGVGSDGLPEWVALRDARHAAVEARYLQWQSLERTPWPAHMEFEDRAAGVELALRFTHIARNSSPARGRLTVRVPPGTARLEWSAIRQALMRARRS